jgi:hypothetical protein
MPTCNRSWIAPFVHSHQTFLDQLVSGPLSFPSHNNVVSKGFHSTGTLYSKLLDEEK